MSNVRRLNTTQPTIEAFFDKVPQELHATSGKVFYTGRLAFERPSPLYVLGINPGGDPDKYKEETVGGHSEQVLNKHPPDWSAYRDESWEGYAPSTYGMAPQVLHMFRHLGLSPGHVPCSNLVFVRSRAEADLGSEMPQLIEACWPFHEFAVAQLQSKVVLCFGATAGEHIKRRLGASRQIDEFRETNKRGWASRVFVSQSGLKVVVVTHPSRVNWIAPAADPSPLVAAALK